MSKNIFPHEWNFFLKFASNMESRKKFLTDRVKQFAFLHSIPSCYDYFNLDYMYFFIVDTVIKKTNNPTNSVKHLNRIKLLIPNNWK